jgi:hypothetical protein
LATLEFIQLMADLARVLQSRCQEKKHVMKKVVGQKQRNERHRYQLKYPNDVQGRYSLTGTVPKTRQAALALS